ncbi:MAG: 4'-phosphopantetheinyl transferase superfamily protein [Pseudomonadota bacterium]
MIIVFWKPPLLENFDFIEPIKGLHDYARVVLVDLAKVRQAQVASFSKYLDSAEQERLENIAVAAKRHAFIVCRFIAKKLIGEFFELDPLALSFQYTERGKPYVPVNGVEFNISHSGDFALIGVSRHKIGVDIEKMKPNRNFKGLAAAVLSDDEKAWVFEQDTRQRFYQLWTLKEARLKCDGEGIAGHFPAATFDVNKGWGYDGYGINTNFIENEYICAVCLLENNIDVLTSEC